MDIILSQCAKDIKQPHTHLYCETHSRRKITCKTYIRTRARTHTHPPRRPRTSQTDQNAPGHTPTHPLSQTTYTHAHSLSLSLSLSLTHLGGRKHNRQTKLLRVSRISSLVSKRQYWSGTPPRN